MIRHSQASTLSPSRLGTVRRALMPNSTQTWLRMGPRANRVAQSRPPPRHRLRRKRMTVPQRKRKRKEERNFSTFLDAASKEPIKDTRTNLGWAALAFVPAQWRYSNKRNLYWNTSNVISQLFLHKITFFICSYESWDKTKHQIECHFGQFHYLSYCQVSLHISDNFSPNLIFRDILEK